MAKADPTAEHVANAEQAAAIQHLTGIAAVTHHLEVAFIHALAGVEDEARKSLARAETEVARFGPALSHLAREIELGFGRVHAVLAGRHTGKPSASK